MSKSTFKNDTGKFVWILMLLMTLMPLTAFGFSSPSERLDTAYSSMGKTSAENFLKAKLANEVAIVNIKRYEGTLEFSASRVDPLERTKIYFSDGSYIILNKKQVLDNAIILEQFKVEFTD